MTIAMFNGGSVVICNQCGLIKKLIEPNVYAASIQASVEGWNCVKDSSDYKRDKHYCSFCETKEENSLEAIKKDGRDFDE